jgi:rsbT antagonist protein RsbS
VIPIIQIHDYLVIPVQETLHDHLALSLQERLGDEIVRREPKAVIIDISTVEVLDSFIARVLDQIGHKALLMGLRTVVVGMQPAVAITLVEMGMDLEYVQTALNIEHAIELLDAQADDIDPEQDADEASGPREAEIGGPPG